MVQAIGQLSTDLSNPPVRLQHNYHQILMPAVVRAIATDPSLRVRVHAARALVNVLEEATEEMVTPHLEGLLQALEALLAPEHPAAARGAGLTGIAALAEHAAEYFHDNYARFVPPCMEVVRAFDGNLDNAAGLKAYELYLEAASLIGMHAGVDVFREDAGELMELTLQHSALLGTASSFAGNIFSAWARINRCLGEGFGAYLPAVMEALLNVANKPMDVEILEGEDAEDADRDDNGVIDVGGRVLRVDMEGMTARQEAMSRLSVLIDDVGPAMAPYVGQIVATTREVFDRAGDMFEELRQAGINVLLSLAQVYCTYPDEAFGVQGKLDLLHMFLHMFASSSRGGDVQEIENLTATLSQALASAKGHEKLCESIRAMIPDILVQCTITANVGSRGGGYNNRSHHISQIPPSHRLQHTHTLTLTHTTLIPPLPSHQAVVGLEKSLGQEEEELDEDVDITEVRLRMLYVSQALGRVVEVVTACIQIDKNTARDNLEPLVQLYEKLLVGWM